MNCWYDIVIYLCACDMICDVLDCFVFMVDVIVGFFGEDEVVFECIFEIVWVVGFVCMYVFFFFVRFGIVVVSFKGVFWFEVVCEWCVVFSEVVVEIGFKFCCFLDGVFEIVVFEGMVGFFGCY